jgi:hypothetical protein
VKKHTQIYLQFFGYDTSDFIPCEVCQARAVDIHHIDARGMGGSKKRDFIENLMALCRKCHDHYGDKVQFKPFLHKTHERIMLQFRSLTT